MVYIRRNLGRLKRILFPKEPKQAKLMLRSGHPSDPFPRLKMPGKSCLDAQISPGSKKCSSLLLNTKTTEREPSGPTYMYADSKWHNQQHDLFEYYNQEHQDADKNQNNRQLRVFPGFAHKISQSFPCPIQGRLMPIHVLFDIIQHLDMIVELISDLDTQFPLSADTDS